MKSLTGSLEKKHTLYSDDYVNILATVESNCVARITFLALRVQHSSFRIKERLIESGQTSSLHFKNHQNFIPTFRPRLSEHRLALQGVSDYLFLFRELSPIAPRPSGFLLILCTADQTRLFLKKALQLTNFLF